MTNFFGSIYPFSEIDSSLFAGYILPHLKAETYQEGNILKGYDEISDEVYIVFDGEVSQLAKTYSPPNSL